VILKIIDLPVRTEMKLASGVPFGLLTTQMVVTRCQFRVLDGL
jgi:hypothetical protein